ncbi:MAG: M81 family metallopeptidase [Ectothiorhodospiraceae bacterium AqS1]|nr:M81 family metallopeptidase [Ectothiorhodospiraceae bacterium AqS1]
MKTFIACLGTETNSFSNLPTGMQTFRDSMYFEGDATRHPPNIFSLPLHIWRRKTEERQGEIVESIAAFAQPAGPTVRSVYEDLRDRILSDLKAALPVDIVLLSLHGAMTAEGYDDCEGDLLSRVREIIGSGVVLGVELDLHCSITPAMTEAADIMVLFKEYPHTDVGPRAEELFDLCAKAHTGEVEPVMAVHDCKMIMKWRTPVEPMKSIVSEMQAAEGQGDILSVSFAHGFPWQDVPHTSGKMLVVADANAQAAKETAQRFAQRLWSVRDEANQKMISTERALDLIEAGPGPVVVADVADNAGGGAPSDSTFVLRAALDRGIAGLMSCHYWDPLAVRFCEEAGEGASIDVRIGGKCGASSGDPVDLRVRIERILPKAEQTFGDARTSMGTAVWVTTGDIDLILTSKRTQVFHPDSMTQLGIDPSAYRGIVVKSTQHFYAGFAPIAARIEYLAGPGAIPPDFATIPFRRVGDDYWPKVQDPFGEG